ncbi:hypothetical protein HOLleu_34886 [Holothuria leucospilota]|uniref:Uncharacterized protein n=1 Tax=Holothuria leucospilota TaxID=206669 RepID=A0A9Q0YLW6_HOLLE|nr:hypothetical protein HOLleu_34886 [Holothuria leucospilota]
MTRRDQLITERIFAILERILQSNDQFTLDERLVIKIIRVEPFKGGKPTSHDLKGWIKAKKSIVRIKNGNDVMCMARAIVTAIACHQKKNGATVPWDNIRKGFGKQTTLAKDLHRRADVPFGRCSLTDLPAFEKVLPEYRIIVVTRTAKILYCTMVKIRLVHHCLFTTTMITFIQSLA